MEALNAVSTYIEDIKEDNVILMQGNLCANIDLEAAIACHEQSGAAITAICSPKAQGGVRYRYILNEDGNSSNRLLLNQTEKGEGIASLEAYILSKELLLSMMKTKQQTNVYRFHAEALFEYLNNGGKLNVYIHNGYAAFITTKGEYFKAATDILAPENRRSVFPGDRPVRTSGLEGVSSYYGAEAKSRNCLVADNCIIEGEIENCILHSGVRIAKGAKLKNCVLFRGTEVGENSELECIVADKYVKFAPGTALKGSPKLPLVIPKGAEI
jgi:glucose-1-phosphate adenylyltransferase